MQDATLAAGLLLLAIVVMEHDETLSELFVRDGLWWTGTVLAVTGVALRRSRPVPMLVLCCAAAVLHLAGFMPLTLVDLSVPILLYTVAVRYGWVRSLVALSALLVLALGSSAFAVTKVSAGPPTVTEPPRPPRARPAPGLDPGPAPAPDAAGFTVESAWAISWDDLPGLSLTLVAAWAIGSGLRSRRAHQAELRARESQRAVLAVAAERARISRELHDVVAHGLSVMVVQAQGGAAALDNRPADTRTALNAIVKTGRDSLADMRRVLGAVGEVDDAWHPQPGLHGLPALVAQVREAGTPVRLRIDGDAVPLPSTVDLTAYRIVQEALTNTMKHAGRGARVEVVVAYVKGALHLEIGDEGRGSGLGDGLGHGLRGMGERVRLLGGRLDAGPRPGGGFRVRAELPIGVRPE